MFAPMPYAHPFATRSSHVRAPPRAQPRTPEPLISMDDSASAYIISLRAPEDHTAQDTRATLAHDGLVLEGRLVTPSNGVYEYVTRRRCGVYAEPNDRAIASTLPAGQHISGGAPTRSGWIALDDDESWLLDDGSVALVSKPSPSRALPFAKKVSLPADAELRRATSESMRDGRGGLRVVVPRTRRTPVPVQPAATHKRSPPKPAPAPKPAAAPQPPPATRQNAEKHTTTTTKRDMSAEDFKQQHKRKAQERRSISESLAALRGEDYAGPVLVESPEASPRNVQSPSEMTEEWVATSDGGFAEVTDDRVAEILRELEGAKAAKKSTFKPVPMEEDEDDLGYYGF